MTRLKDPTIRREQILMAALEIARRDSYLTMTRDEVAAHAGVGPSTVNAIFGTMDALRQEVMRAAILREVVEIVADGLRQRDPIARKCPASLKQKAAALLLS